MKKWYYMLLVCVMTILFVSCGHSHVWEDATCVRPKMCVECEDTEGEPLGHQWQEASCEKPRTCSVCGEEDGSALGHMWIAATCQRPQYCNVCGINEGVSLSHNWKPADAQTPQMCLDCGAMVPFELPESGTVFLGDDLFRGSELTIHTADDEACYVKLKQDDGSDVFSFFVRAGERATVPVPFGSYYVFFAYGTDWYGPEFVFGDDTSYGKDEEICDFEKYTWEYTFVKSANGNFTETPIDPDEF